MRLTINEDRYDRMSDDYYARAVDDYAVEPETEERITKAVITAILLDDIDEYAEEFDYEKEDLEMSDDEFIDYVEKNAAQIVMDILDGDDTVELIDIADVSFETDEFDVETTYDEFNDEFDDNDYEDL